MLRHASVGSTAEIGYLIRIPGVRSEQPYVAVDTSLVRISVIRDIVDHIYYCTYSHDTYSRYSILV